MFNHPITDRIVLRMQKDINENWASIESIFIGEDIEKLVKLSEHLDDRNLSSLVKKYNELPPTVLVYVNHFFQTGVAEFLLRTVKKEQLEQIYGGNQDDIV